MISTLVGGINFSTMTVDLFATGIAAKHSHCFDIRTHWKPYDMFTLRVKIYIYIYICICVCACVS